MKTKDKILLSSLELFNRLGVGATSTNHIARELSMSPGNLYFHFSNKEEIIKNLFLKMAQETYEIWKAPANAVPPHPLDLIDRNFEIFWRYRFLHREISNLRRNDKELSQLWRAHLLKIKTKMKRIYLRWVKLRMMKPIDNPEETEFVTNVLLATSSSFMLFFESNEKMPAKKHLELGKKYVAKLIVPWTEGQTEQDFKKFIAPISQVIPSDNVMV